MISNVSEDGNEELSVFNFFAVTKRTTNIQTKISKTLPENAFKAVKPYFGPQNMLDCTFFEHR